VSLPLWDRRQLVRRRADATPIGRARIDRGERVPPVEHPLLAIENVGNRVGEERLAELRRFQTGMLERQFEVRDFDRDRVPERAGRRPLPPYRFGRSCRWFVRHVRENVSERCFRVTATRSFTLLGALHRVRADIPSGSCLTEPVSMYASSTSPSCSLIASRSGGASARHEPGRGRIHDVRRVHSTRGTSRS